jgi:hypothetical protein
MSNVLLNKQYSSDLWPESQAKLYCCCWQFAQIKIIKLIIKNAVRDNFGFLFSAVYQWIRLIDSILSPKYFTLSLILASSVPRTYQLAADRRM